MHQILMKTAIKLSFFHIGDLYTVENKGTRFYRTVAEWQRITNIHQDNEACSNVIHFFALFTLCTFDVKNK